MILSESLLIISGFITAGFCFAAFWLWRGHSVPVNSCSFIAMGVGSASIGLFYVGVELAATGLIMASRLLWFFILVSTSAMALAAIFTAQRATGE